MLTSGGSEVVYRLAVYAPPVKGKENDPLRWNLAMQMLQLPNTAVLAPPVAAADVRPLRHLQRRSAQRV